MLRKRPGLFARLLDRPWLMIVLMSVLLMLGGAQGLEMTDEGFWGCFYQQIFASPESVRYNFLYWLTGVVGGGWHLLWPSGGLFGFRLLGVLITCGAMLMSLALLKDQLGRRVLSVALLLTASLQNSMVNIFYEKNWCGFLTVCLIFGLYRGLSRQQGAWMFFSGAVGMMLAFSRIPSVVLLALGGSPLFYVAIRGIPLRAGVKSLAWFAAGTGAGAAALAGGMTLLGHAEIFASSFRFMAEMAADSSDGLAHHGIKALVILFGAFLLYVCVKGAAVAGILGVAVCGTRFVCGRIPHRLIRLSAQTAALLLMAIGVLYVARSPLNPVAILMCFTGVALLPELLGCVAASPERRLLVFLALGGMVLLPVGSNAPLSVVRYSLWVALPLAVDRVACFLQEARPASAFETAETGPGAGGRAFLRSAIPDIRRALLVCGLVLLALNARFLWTEVYRDGCGRLNMFSPVDSAVARGVLTGPARSQALDGLLKELRRQVRKGDELLVFANMPAAHMLTETRPYLGVSWVKCLSVEQFSRALETAALTHRKLPVVVAHKRNVGEASWPRQAAPYLTASHVAPRYAVLSGFLQAHHYNRTWENDDFLIWSPVPNPEALH